MDPVLNGPEHDGTRVEPHYYVAITKFESCYYTSTCNENEATGVTAIVKFTSQYLKVQVPVLCVCICFYNNMMHSQRKIIIL